MTAKILEFNKSPAVTKMYERMYEASVGVNLTPEKIKAIRLYTAILFGSTDAHVVVLKDKNAFTVLVTPYFIKENKVSYFNPIKYLYKKLTSSITIFGIQHNVKDMEEALSEYVGNTLKFERYVPQVPALKLEEIIKNEQSKAK